MAQPTELILKDVRCFEGEQCARLRPITLLVGENSTGKSTFLACYSVIHRMFSASRNGYDDSPDFNREPFSMGSFRDIVRSRRGPAGRINEFQIGLRFDQSREAGLPPEITVAFREQGSQPAQRSCLYRFGPSGFLELRRQDEEKVKLVIPDRELDVEWPPFPNLNLEWHLFLALDARRPQSRSSDPNRTHVLNYVRNLLNPDKSKRLRPESIHLALRDVLHAKLIPVAPLRTKPRRTYDPVRETDSPEGEHVPMLMMRLDHGEKTRWQSLRTDLVEFGKKAGLFSDIKVRRHGKQISDPFQLQAKARSSSHANIMDVGYGVSQSLPILVSLLSGKGNGASGRRSGRAGNTFLLQQPEVHLHPRGQAELAALFAKVAKKGNGRDRFLIETHSDHIVDRIRIGVRQGALRPDDVSIIFFEPGRNAVQMRNIALDKFGNLTDAPPGYRSFFLRETDRLLGFDD